MRWHNHKLITVSLIYATTGGFVPSLCAMSGAILPDTLELGIIPHRTITHWVYPYIVLLTILHLLSTSYRVLPYLLFFIVLGAVLHIAEDSMSISGVPLGKTPNSGYWGLGLYCTRSIREELTALALVLTLNIIAYWRGFFESNHIQSQVGLIGRLIKLGVEALL